MYYKSFFSRFVFRRKLWRKVTGKLQYYSRKVFKDEFEDLRFVFDAAQIEPEVIVDGGANIGFVTHQFRKSFPKAKIISIEPSDKVFQKLKEAYKADTAVLPLNVGISAAPGTMEFNVNANTGTSSFLHPNAYHASHLAKTKLETRTIRTISLDSLAAENNLDRIDILKLDIEGYELEALKGAEALLAKQHVRAILLEVNLIESYERQPLFFEIAAYLHQRNYFAFNFYGFHESKLRQSILTNLIFLSGDFRNRIKDRFGNECGW
ncbi:MAG: FkbM family methyltransferase [Cyclobacteriaceae bacterium]|nr:FkbM family methyltransferase [Cyclobacteriaceae bacterium]